MRVQYAQRTRTNAPQPAPLRRARESRASTTKQNRPRAILFFVPHEAPCEVWLSFLNTHMSVEQKNKTPNCLGVLLLEAWVGIEPAYKDLQSSA